MDSFSGFKDDFSLNLQPRHFTTLLPSVLKNIGEKNRLSGPSFRGKCKTSRSGTAIYMIEAKVIWLFEVIRLHPNRCNKEFYTPDICNCKENFRTGTVYPSSSFGLDASTRFSNPQLGFASRSTVKKMKQKSPSCCKASQYRKKKLYFLFRHLTTNFTPYLRLSNGS